MLLITDLNVLIEKNGIAEPVLTDIRLTLKAGEIFGLTGKSGVGKTVFAKTVSGLLEPPFKIATGRFHIAGTPIPIHNPKTWHDIRGRKVFMIFQSASMALNPTMKIGEQIAEVLRDLFQYTRKAANDKASSLLERVGMSRRHADYYPHQISGGMRRRVQIAVALALEPKILIADEPTTGLDPMTRKGIIDLLTEIVEERGMAMILISHDLPFLQAVPGPKGILQNGRLFSVETFGTETPRDDDRRHMFRPETGSRRQSALPLK